MVTTGTTAPYYCSTTNNWTAFGSGGGGVTFPTGVLYGNNSTSAPTVATAAQANAALGLPLQIPFMGTNGAGALVQGYQVAPQNYVASGDSITAGCSVTI